MESRKVLTLQDRCDRCGSQAYMLAIFPSGLELTFCLHHARQYKDSLMALGAIFYDESALSKS